MRTTAGPTDSVTMSESGTLGEAVALTARDRSVHRTDVEADLLQDRFVAEFVAASESLAGNPTSAAEVFDAVRDLAVG